MTAKRREVCVSCEEKRTGVSRRQRQQRIVLKAREADRLVTAKHDRQQAARIEQQQRRHDDGSMGNRRVTSRSTLADALPVAPAATRSRRRAIVGSDHRRWHSWLPRAAGDRSGCRCERWCQRRRSWKSDGRAELAVLRSVSSEVRRSSSSTSKRLMRSDCRLNPRARMSFRSRLPEILTVSSLSDFTNDLRMTFPCLRHT
mgnify:CR=1 FL=1